MFYNHCDVFNPHVKNLTVETSFPFLLSLSFVTCKNISDRNDTHQHTRHVVFLNIKQNTSFRFITLIFNIYEEIH